MNKIEHRLHACMHTAWQHTWRLHDTIATPHAEQAAASTPLRRTQQRSFTPNCRAKGRLCSINLSHISPSLPVLVPLCGHFLQDDALNALNKFPPAAGPFYQNAQLDGGAKFKRRRRLGHNCSPAVILTTGLRMKGGSPRMLVDAFGWPDAFC